MQENNYQIGDIVLYKGIKHEIISVVKFPSKLILKEVESNISKWIPVPFIADFSDCQLDKPIISIPLKFVVIREKATGKIWDAALLPDDEEKYVYLSTSSQGNVNDFSKAYNDFTNNFAGTNNANDFKDTDYFSVEYVDKSLTFY